MSRKLIIGITVLAVLATFLFYSIVQAATDDFESYTDNQVLADTDCYTFVSFPGVGAGDDGTCGQNKWEMDTGSVEAQEDSTGNMWGFLPNTDIFRLNTQDTTQDSVVTWRYKASEANNAADVWLRYQTQYWLYIIQFDRNDGCIVAKRKVPTNTAASGQWGGVGAGHSAEIANAGVYYTLLLDEDTPVEASSCNVDGITWTNAGTSTITHNGTLNGGTTYNFKATITTIPAATCGKAFDCTQLQLFRGGELVASWTDDNSGKNFNGTRTVQQDCDAGWYTGVTGYQAAWCKPITAAGKSGFRNDDANQVWIDDFSMTEAGGGGEPEPDPPAGTGGMSLRKGVVKLQTGTIILR